MEVKVVKNIVNPSNITKIKYFLQGLNPFYYLKHWINRKRKKILKISTLDNTWHDQTEVLLHTSFQTLVNFIEKEKPGELIEWEADPGHSKAWKTMTELYNWWTVIRPNRVEPIEELDSDLIPPLEFEPTEDPNLYKFVFHSDADYPEYAEARKESNRLEIEWNKEDQKNLHKLIMVRNYMWT